MLADGYATSRSEFIGLLVNRHHLRPKALMCDRLNCPCSGKPGVAVIECVIS